MAFVAILRLFVFIAILDILLQVQGELALMVTVWSMQA